MYRTHDRGCLFWGGVFTFFSCLLLLPSIPGTAATEILSDEFTSPTLNSFWRFYDPLAGGDTSDDSLLNHTGTNLEIVVPGGASHNLWPSQMWAPRLLQPAGDEDFEVEAKFDTDVMLKYQIQGLVVQEADDTLIRYEVHHDGANIKVFAATIMNGGSPSVKANATVTLAASIYLRVNRSGSLWTLDYSDDGHSWTTATSFTRNIVVNEVGLFAGNHASNPTQSPAFTASIDYFRNTSLTSPVAVDDAVTTPQDTPVENFDVLANDNANGQTINVTTVVASDSSNGTVVVNATTGLITYTPDSSYSGLDTFTYTVDDTEGNTSNTATVTVTVNSSAAAPIAVNDAVSTPQGTPVQNFAVLANDNANGQTIDIATVVASDPSNGTVIVNAMTGTITYTPDVGFGGTDTFTYMVDDTEGDTSNTATVTVTVSSNAAAPIAMNDAVSTPQNTPVQNFAVLANDDANGQTIDVTTVVASDPPNGTVVVNATTGTITYTPDMGFGGTDTFTYTVDDTQGDTSNVGTVTVMVTVMSSTAPIIDVWYSTDQGFGQVGRPQEWVNIVGNVSDPNGPTSSISLTYSLNGGPTVPLTVGRDGLRLEHVGDFNVDIDADELLSGNNSVEFVASDQASEVATKTVFVNYTPGTLWPLPYSIDWTEVSATSEILNFAQVVDGKWSIDVVETDAVRIVEPGWDRLLAIGDMSSWENYEVETRVTFNTVTSSSSAAFGFVHGWTGHTSDPPTGPSGQPLVGAPLGAISWYRLRVPNPPRLEISNWINNSEVRLKVDNSGFTLSPGKTYSFRSRTQALTSGVLYTLKVWEVGQPESSGSLIQVLNNPPQPVGSLLLLAHKADVTFGPTNVIPIGNTPAAFDDSSGTVIDVPVIINVLNNDDANGQSLDPSSLTITGGPTNGSTLVNATTGEITYTPNSGFTGSDSFTYAVADIQGDFSNEAQANITVGTEIQSDEFSSTTLNSFWTFFDPLAGAAPASDDSSFNLTGTTFNLAVPGGASHDLFPPHLFAPRLLQDTINTDFEIEAKFDSMPTDKFQLQGLVVQETDQTLIRYDVYHDGNNVNIFAAAITGGGGASVKVNTAVTLTAPFFLRINRTGDLWTLDYSDNGQTWMTATSFVHNLIVKQVGIFAGNDHDDHSQSPAFTASVDYFRNTASTTNQAPTVAAGADQAVTLQSGANLNGTVTDDGLPTPPMVNTVWSLTSGPGTVTFGNAAAVDTTASFTAEGVYVLRLTADDTALSTFDEVTITVAATNQAPTVAAGADQAVTLQSGANLDGTVTDDGLPTPPTVNTVWSITSGPGTVTFGNAAAVDTTASFTAEGVYVLRLTADDTALSTFDEVTITVAATNQAPTVAAGADQAVTLQSGANLDGTVTDDGLPTPPTVNTVWSMTSGPGTVTFGNAAAVDTTASFTAEGVYVLRLTADDTALSTFDEVTITVAATNQAPTVAAGADQAVTLQSGANLDGTVTDDGLPTPPTVNTVWSMTSGPGTVTFGNAAAVDTTASFTAEGVYVLRLTADDTALSTFDEVTITVGATTSIQSDEFTSTTLNPFWRFFDPLAGVPLSDDSSYLATGTHLEIAVPGGSSHNLWPGQMFAPRLLQGASDTDFEIEAKFDTDVMLKYQIQGLVVQEADETLIRYEVHHDGANVKIFAATITNGGSPSVKANATVALAASIYLRVNRSANLWTLDYSDDGQSWTTATSFSRTIVVDEVGFFAGNHASNPTQSPAFTASIDYFRNNSSP
ncbi:Ig-like domain-containing protein [Nitrospira sp. M1]